MSLEFSDIVHVISDTTHCYYHTRTFTESNGVGVDLTEGQLCFGSTADCDPAVSVDYRIEGNDQLVHYNKKFWTSYSSDEFILKYWGTDDNGNPIYVEQSLSHPYNE